MTSDLPDPLPLDATEAEADDYAARLHEACQPILLDPLVYGNSQAASIARLWLIYLMALTENPAVRQRVRAEHGQDIRDLAAAQRAIELWRRVMDWYGAERQRNPRFALRELMSELSEDASCASWDAGIEDVLWMMLHGDRAWKYGRQYGRLTVSDTQIAELRRLHEAAGGWWRWKNGPDVETPGGLEFLPTEEWIKVHAKGGAES
jgi:hypothetical protein